MKQKQSIRISQEHKLRYIELAQRGVTGTEAVRVVSKEFEMAEPHTRSAVAQLVKGIEKEKNTKYDRAPRGRQTTKPTNGELSLERVEELVIARFQEAKEVRLLRNRLAATENTLRNTQIELAQLEKYHKDQEDKKRRFKLAQQQGEIKSLEG